MPPNNMWLKKLIQKIQPLLPEICAYIVFLTISCLWLRFHETWLDETQAWLLARDTGSYWNMIKMMSYEGHPALWHSLLFILVKLNLPFFSVRILHLIIANLTALLILFKSPFKRSIKIPLIFGYFFIYEYNAISRSYALAVLLMFLIAFFYQKRFTKPILYSILVALLANTVIHGTVIAFSIFLLFIYELVAANIKKIKAVSINQYAAILIMILSFFLVVLQVKPSADSTMDLPWLETRTTAQPLVAIASAFFPIPKNQIDSWNSHLIPDVINDIIDPIYSWYWYLGILAFVGITTYTLSLLFFAGKTRILILYITTSALLFLVFLLINSGLTRHHGLLFVNFIFCLWLAEYYEKKPSYKNFIFDKKYLNYILYFFLAIQITAGIIAGYSEIIYDFSAAQKTANYLKQSGLINNENLLIGYPNNPVASITSYLPNTKLFYIEDNNFGTYVTWNKRYAKVIKFNDFKIYSILSDLVNNTNYKKDILIINYSLRITHFPLQYKLLNFFSPTIVSGESFYVYEISPKLNRAFDPNDTNR